MQDRESLTHEIRSFVQTEIGAGPDYFRMEWDRVVDEITRKALSRFLSDDLTRAIQSDWVEQIVVQEATKAGLNPDRQ
ncbi:MAG: hypothetical protein RIM99_20450 [Cyclobacteriaceae bacterium]